MKAHISGLGLWVPSTVRRNDAWGPNFKQAHLEGDRTLVDMPTDDQSRGGRIAARYIASDADDPFFGSKERRTAGEITGAMAESLAAERALGNAGIDGSDLDVVISFQTGPDRITPPSAVRVAAEVRATRALTFNMEAACATGVIQVQVARALIESGQARHVLLTQSHLITQTLPMSHPASPGIGDAATAQVLSASEKPGILSFESVVRPELFDAVTWRRGPGLEADTPWWKGGGDFRMGTLDRDAAKFVMERTVAFGAESVAHGLRSAGLQVRDVNVLATTQPRAWVPPAIGEALGLEGSATAPSTFEEFAHVGACGAFINLQRAEDEGLLKPGSIAAIYQQGAGFIRAAVVLRWKPDEV